MNKLIAKPYIFFWSVIPIMFLIVLFIGYKTYTINVHDTYFVFSNLALVNGASIVFCMIGLIYWALIKSNKLLSKSLNISHLVITIDGLLLMFIFSQLFRDVNTDTLLETSSFNHKIGNILFVIFLLIILAQVLFIINIIRSLFINNK